MPTVGFLSMGLPERSFFESAIYDVHLIGPMQERGWTVDAWVPWREFQTIQWSKYDIVLVRSPWDYQHDIDLYAKCLRHITRVSPKTIVWNDVETVLWNVSKGYLQELEEHGAVPIIPSVFVPEKDVAQRSVIDVVRHAFEVLFPAAAEVVIKPMVSANADFTFRLKRESLKETVASLDDPLLGRFCGSSSCGNVQKLEAECHTLSEFLQKAFVPSADESVKAPTRCRGYLIQPFLGNVLSEGEFSLFYFGGVLSHATKKIPRNGDFRVQEEWGGNSVLMYTASRPDTEEAVPRELVVMGGRVLDFVAAKFGERVLYARFDFIRLDDGTFGLAEIEVNEPSLYFNVDRTAAVRFVDVFETFAKEKGIVAKA
eukprot:PhM_4_TR15580/c0_g1_i1/m.63283